MMILHRFDLIVLIQTKNLDTETCKNKSMMLIQHQINMDTMI